MHSFAETMTEAKKAKGWTLDRLAEETGLHAHTLCLYATGRVQPTVPNANKVLAALGVSMVIGRREDWCYKYDVSRRDAEFVAGDDDECDGSCTTCAYGKA